MLRVASLSILLAWSIGCETTDLVGNDCQLEGRPCPDPPGGAGGTGGDISESFDALDLLVVVDDGPSMAAKEQAVAAQLPELTRVLLSGDYARDGEELDFTPVTTLRVAIVSSDMGAPGLRGLSDCGEDTGNGVGDDGWFNTETSLLTDMPNACIAAAAQPSFVTFMDASTTTLEQVMACRTLVGTTGCMHPMPLEAALKALWDQPNDPQMVRFVEGTGHGITGQPQAGFLRERALLGVIVVTDKDDCSLSGMRPLTAIDDPSLDPNEPLAQLDRGLRCWSAGDALYPVNRYKQAFGSLKSGLLRRVFFGVIAAVPEDALQPLTAAASAAARNDAFVEVHDHPSMQQTPDPDSPLGEHRLRESCGGGEPPRRLVELARRFEERSAVASICGDMTEAVRTLTRRLALMIDPQARL